MGLINPQSARLFIGNSPKVRRVMQQIENMGRHEFPVLILGETGTGKELIAKMIHDRTTAGPFVVIDCSAISPTLIESELFGHVKGAFTGAGSPKTGLIELADGGTAFFDEVGELPLDMQAKLLRVLQEKEFRPLGATWTKKSAFRIIAATNRELATEAERGTFRRDLYYRLKVLTLRLPPLRERREDIPMLIAYFLEQYGHQYSVTPAVVTALTQYHWPGNVRELKHCIQHMVAVAGQLQLQTGDMPSAVLSHVVIREAPSFGAIPVSDDECPILPLREVERREILRAMEHTKGDRTLAATLLGIGRTTLYRKLQEYGARS